MALFFAIVFLLIFGAEFFVGVTSNAFIAIVNLLSLAKGIVLNPNDQVLLSLGLSNLCVQCTCVVAELAFFFYEEFYKNFGSETFFFFFVFSNAFSTWLTGLLLVTCYMMMNRTPSPLLLWVKRIFIKYMFWILALMFGFAFATGLFAAGCHASNLPHDVAANLTSNSSHLLLDFCSRISFRVNLVIWLYICPLIVTSFHVVQILTYIWRHIWSIKKNMAGTNEWSLKAHTDASNTLTALLVLYLLNSLTGTVIILVDSSFGTWFLMCMAMFSTLTTAQAVTLILGNARLKKEALRILQVFTSSTGDNHSKRTDAVSNVTPP